MMDVRDSCGLTSLHAHLMAGLNRLRKRLSVLLTSFPPIQYVFYPSQLSEIAGFFPYCFEWEGTGCTGYLWKT